MEKQEGTFKTILKYIRKNIFAATAIFTGFFILINILVAVFYLQLRLYIMKAAVIIMIIGFGIGTIQLLHRIKNKTTRVISYIATVVLLILTSEIWFLFGLVFFIQREEVVIRDDIKCVAIQNEFLDIFRYYYEYKNPLVCGNDEFITEHDPACSRSGCNITYKDYTKHPDVYDERNSNRFFFEILSERYTYKAKQLLSEKPQSVKVNLTELGKDEYCPIYSFDIDYGDCEGRYTEDGRDRFNIGLLLVTSQYTYLLQDYSGDTLPTMEDFQKNGIIICAKENMDEVINGKHIEIKESDKECICIVTDTTGEAGYYAEYRWAKYNGLKYYKESYGWEKDAIELKLKKCY